MGVMNIAIPSGNEIADELRRRIAEMTPGDLGRLMRREGSPIHANPFTDANMELRAAAWKDGWREVDASFKNGASS